jgi:hypothetical protein
VLFLLLVLTWSRRRQRGDDEAAPCCRSSTTTTRAPPCAQALTRLPRSDAVSDFVHSGWACSSPSPPLSPAGLPGLLIIASTPPRDGRRQHHRPRLGRRPARDEQPAAALVDGLFVITVVFAAVYLAFYPGLGSARAC